MSYDSAIWEGERPGGDGVAHEAFLTRAEHYLEYQNLPPTSQIAYMSALPQRRPDSDDDAGLGR